MAGEFCGVWCGHCGRCDVDYHVECLTRGCHNAVTFPDFEVYCSDCQTEFRVHAILREQEERRVRLVQHQHSA